MFDTSSISVCLTDYFTELGYTAENQNGSSVIRKFSEPEDECYSLYHGVGLRDISNSGIIEMRGKDVIDFLHRISTNNLSDMKKEEIRKTIFTSDKGRIIGLGTLFNFVDYQLLMCSKDNKRKVMSWINKYVISDDVKVSDAGHKYCLLELLGPQAESFISLIVGSSTEIEENRFKVLHIDSMLFFLARLTDVRGFTRFWVIADYENSRKITKYLIENKGPFDFNLIGEDAYYSYRMQLGIPDAPNELNDNFNPYDLDLLHLIDFKKGCYIGQEVIARLDTYDKAQRTLVNIKFEEEIPFNEKFTILTSDFQEAGIVTSSGYSHKNKKYIGLGVIKKSLLTSENSFLAKDESGKQIPIKVQIIEKLK